MQHPDVHKPIRVAGSDVAPLAGLDPMELTCGPEGCTSTCCKNGPPIVLNPYEISRICVEDGLTYEDFLDIVESDRVNGFPLIMLPRDPVCHFWSGTGCRVYRARPLACRLFPLGRVFDNGRSHIVLPERNRCTGLVPSPHRTLADYLTQQDTALHLEMADRWIEFVSEMEQLVLPDKPVTSVAFHLLVYSPDTPPAVGSVELPSSPEDLFLLRLATARKQLPRSLRSA
jgi:Fe-S-cluster containining protein